MTFAYLPVTVQQLIRGMASFLHQRAAWRLATLLVYGWRREAAKEFQDRLRGAPVP